MTEAERLADAIDPLKRRGLDNLTCSVAASELRRLQAENDVLRKDAERYRWVRTAGAWESEIAIDILSEDPVKFDAAIDAEMKGKT